MNSHTCGSCNKTHYMRTHHDWKAHSHLQVGLVMQKCMSCVKCLFETGSNSIRERSGSVVECLTRDRGAAGSSLTGVTALCP